MTAASLSPEDKGTPAYRCNCGQTFPSHLARTAHSGGCEVMQSGRRQTVQTGLATGFPLVQGRCPSCRGRSLFLGAGGHVTCSRLDCPDPCAVDTLLSDDATGADR